VRRGRPDFAGAARGGDGSCTGEGTHAGDVAGAHPRTSLELARGAGSLAWTAAGKTKMEVLRPARDEGNWVFTVGEGGIWVPDFIPVQDSNDAICLVSVLLETT
jgi:hypothetical protein